MKRSRIILTLVVFAAFTWVFYSGGGLQPAKAEAAEALKAAFIYVGPIGDLGWSWEHDRGRKMLETEFGDKVKTAYIESVPEGPDAARVIRQYAQQGYKVIFATSFGYMDPMLEVARDFPGVFFEHCSGYKTAPNMSTYFGRMYQPRYLSGIVAGKMTKTNVIGYVAAFPIPEVIRGINAFTLGARSVNPSAQVRVVWTSTWFDPVKEREAAVALLDAGADMIAQHQDTTEPQKAAKERGLMSIGYDSDMRGFVGDSVLASPIWNWGSYYVNTVNAILNGTWKTHQYWGGLKEGIVQLSDYSPKVPQAVRGMVAAKQQEILNGTWDVFYGPIKDQNGKEVVAAGGKMSDPDMLNMSYFVEGVIGKAGK
jgi:basic membrane protein A